MMRLRLLALGGFMSVAAGCVTHREPQHIYSLEGAVEESTQVVAGTQRPVMRLQRVLIPDYLDTVDILSREGAHEVHESATGRFAERLSAGITHALRSDLASRLPQYSIALTQPPGAPTRQIAVTVDQLDMQPNGRCVLVADWTLVDADRKALLSVDRGTFNAAASDVGPRDDAIVAALADVVRQLADRIAVSAGASGTPNAYGELQP